ncbi:MULTISPECIES: hypothetical protein [unclassified Planococcus (in: firmicutes)]|uniref:hypothetical protein n=1 Tax=unclassified Planococcus (in: firmicutes) TaxID=2662419 RepID=UPI000C7D82A0|nr:MULTISPECIES: hypothetical protein [unclassified Planococcus (in: firmicutes)]PKG48914.1 hypothetical protein CXF66_00040 [Planococcus sp. Urea-trap-24]PKG89689.1 hypothetical protein CXF91_05760 [Planococcus sp. Urea-3u-39]
MRLLSESFIRIAKGEMDLIKCNVNDIVYVSGSLIEGIGNSLSDLDFYVICDTVPNDISNPFERVDIIESKELLIDVNYLQRDEVEKLINLVNSATRMNSVGLLSNKQKRLIHRLLHCQVFQNSDSYNFLKANLDFEKFKMTSIQDLELQYRDTYQDLTGNLLAKKFYTSYINCIKLLDITIQLTNLSYGETNPSEKWRIEKLAIINKSQLEEFWNIYSRKISSIEDVFTIKREIDLYYSTLYEKISKYLPESRRDDRRI